jgi:hypothetical protein
MTTKDLANVETSCTQHQLLDDVEQYIMYFCFMSLYLGI